MLTQPLGLGLGVVVGLVLGLTGAGGSAFAVPLLMFALGWSLPQAAPVALLAVCAAAAFGTIAAWDVTYVRYRAAMLMAIVGVVFAPLGFWLAQRLSALALAWIFAAALVIVALRMIAQARTRPDEARVARATVSGDEGAASGPICKLDDRTGRLIWTRASALVIASIGAVTGLLSALLGVGGGFVIVPSLRSVSMLSIHSAIATSLMAIALIGAGSVLVHLAMGGSFDWLTALPFVAGSLIGMMLGRRIAPRIVGPLLQQAFALSMLVVAVLVVWRASR